MSQEERDIAALGAILLAAKPSATVQLEHIFVAPARIKPTEHEWYYGAECGHCHRTSAAFQDPNEGQRKLRFSGGGGIRFHCHHCNGLLRSTPGQIVWFEFEG